MRKIDVLEISEGYYDAGLTHGPQIVTAEMFIKQEDEILCN